MRQAVPSAGPVQSPMPRHSVLYCTPHMKIPGVLAVSPHLVTFEPDPEHPHVREFGVDQYAVHLEVPDIFDCGALTMPVEANGVEGSGIAYYLQLHVRTLDGRRYCAKDTQSAWCVVFRMQERGPLYEVARLLLENIDRQAGEEPSPEGRQSSTSIPFPCLDCLAELEEQRLRRSEVCNQHQTRPCQSSTVRLRLGDVKTLLTHALAECLVDYLPIGLRLPGAVEWVLRYTPKAHGVSMATLFRNLADHDNTVLVIKDSEAHVFGGFAPAPWEPCPGRFYGSGEAFVFTFGQLGEQAELQVYPWSNKNSCFMYSDNDLLAMGGGDGRHAVVVRNDLLHGCSSPTVTFGNPTLAGFEEFIVRDLEIWALEENE